MRFREENTLFDFSPVASLSGHKFEADKWHDGHSQMSTSGRITILGRLRDSFQANDCFVFLKLESISGYV